MKNSIFVALVLASIGFISLNCYAGDNILYTNAQNRQILVKVTTIVIGMDVSGDDGEIKTENGNFIIEKPFTADGEKYNKELIDILNKSIGKSVDLYIWKSLITHEPVPGIAGIRSTSGETYDSELNKKIVKKVDPKK